jgi:thiamine-phosphate pyrophosphorylase
MRLPRVYPILDTASLERRGCSDWGMAARGMIAGGAEWLQLRHKGEWTRAAFAQAEEIAEECRREGVTFIVNDRADLAKLLGAGLHVGQDDLAPADCRVVIGDEPVLGFSTHNAAQLSAAAGEPVNYLAFGPVFTTASKEKPDPLVGLEMLAEARGLVGAKPLVAIGGITRDTALSVFAAGADSLALIGDLLPVRLTESTIRDRMEEWHRLTRQ